VPDPRLDRRPDRHHALHGSPTARVLAIVFVAINAVSQIVWFPLAPLWAFLIILLDVTLIYQLTACWDE
jgi:hypothetical protein